MVRRARERERERGIIWQRRSRHRSFSLVPSLFVGERLSRNERLGGTDRPREMLARRRGDAASKGAGARVMLEISTGARATCVCR